MKSMAALVLFGLFLSLGIASHAKTPLEIADLNQGVCVFTKSVPNEIHIANATPNKKVALIMGKGPGSYIIGGSVCNGVELGLSQPRIVGIYKADIIGEVWVESPLPPSGNLAKAHFQLVDVASCTTNEAKQYFLVPDELPDADLDGDGLLNCQDECPTDATCPEGCENPSNLGKPCDDGSICTENDTCVAEDPDGRFLVCLGDVVDCDDGNSCTLDNCSEFEGCFSVNAEEGVPCDDGDVCTQDEVCNDNGACGGGFPICMER